MDETLWRSPDEAAKKLAPVFKAMEWTWGEGRKPPSENDIAVQFEGLEDRAKCKKGISSRSSGRLCVMIIPEKRMSLFGLDSAFEPDI